MGEESGVSPYPIVILIGTIVLGVAAAVAAFRRHKRKERGGAPRDE